MTKEKQQAAMVVRDTKEVLTDEDILQRVNEMLESVDKIDEV